MQVQRLGDASHDWQLYRGEGRLAIEWYFRDTTNLAANVMLYHFEPGVEEGEHLHEAGNDDSCSTYSSDEMYVVIEGELVMTLGDERAVLGVGDAMYAPHGSLHGVRNESDAVARLLLVFGPPRDPAGAPGSPPNPAP